MDDAALLDVRREVVGGSHKYKSLRKVVSRGGRRPSTKGSKKREQLEFMQEYNDDEDDNMDDFVVNDDDDELMSGDIIPEEDSMFHNHQ
jgi:hypothetical protein